MRFSYQYTNYVHSKAATKWSVLGGQLTAYSVVMILLYMFLIYKCTSFVFINLNIEIIGYIVSLILSIFIHIFSINFCKKKEAECAIFDTFKEKNNRELTDVEKKEIRKSIWSKKRI